MRVPAHEGSTQICRDACGTCFGLRRRAAPRRRPQGGGGDLGKRDQLTGAMRKTVVDSPRGKFTISPAGNPVQDIYLREVKGNNNEFRSIAVKGLADPGRGCRM